MADHRRQFTLAARLDLQDAEAALGIVEGDPLNRGQADERPANAASITVKIVRRPPDQIGVAVHPRGWAVKGFFAWISRNRWLWKDLEATRTSASAFRHAPHPTNGTGFMSFGPACEQATRCAPAGEKVPNSYVNDIIAHGSEPV